MQRGSHGAHVAVCRLLSLTEPGADAVLTERLVDAGAEPFAGRADGQTRRADTLRPSSMIASV